MRNIGIFHYLVGHTDGVSLEIDKWKRVLEELGHKVHLCAGDLGTVEGTLIGDIYHHRPDAERLYYNTFIQLRDYPDEAAYRTELMARADVIEKRVSAFVRDKEIDFLLPQNIWAVAANPPVSIALGRIMRDLDLPALAHHHDFFWERTDGVALTNRAAIELADKYLPPRSPRLKHVVINSLARRSLAERRGLDATVVPNVFDFDAPAWQPDDYNRDFRARIGLRDSDVLVLQATRIVQRKGIELAVDFVRALDQPQRRATLKARGLYDGRRFDDDSRIVLVLAGYARDDVTGRYVARLRRKIEREGIDALFIEDVIDARRHTVDDSKIYSLWDSYVYADFVTYPSLWEGWGNQFLEALRARLPVLLWEYPVYKADIGDKGFRTVSLGSRIEATDDLGLVQVAPQVMEIAADQAVDLLTDSRMRTETVEHNFELAQQHYSMPALRTYLARLMED